MMSLNSSLLQWLSTFELDGKKSVEPTNDAYFKLADGYVCARILNQISPQNFPDLWLEGIKPVSPDTNRWPLRTSNLNRILQKISDYASDLQSPQFTTTEITPDVSLIALHFNPDQISRLIQLILFCSINCDKKQFYIDKIQSLPTQVKKGIKEAIEELLIQNNEKISTSHSVNNHNNNEIDADHPININRKPSGNSFQSTSTRRSLFRANMWTNSSSQASSDTSRRNESNQDVSNNTSEYNNENYEEVKQACHNLELKLRQLQLEKDQLAYENERLSRDKNSSRLTSTPIKSMEASYRNSLREGDLSNESKEINSRLKNLEDENSRNLILKQNEKLKEELHRLKEELIKLETEKEDYRLKSSILNDEIVKQALKQDELRNKAEQVKKLQDDLDEYKHLSDKVVDYEKKVENLVKKNNELKKELKNMEEKNVFHIHQIVRLEEENKEVKDSFSRIEIYKKQLQDAQVKLSQETYRADKAEVELTKAMEKYRAIKQENEKLYETTNQLLQGIGTSVEPKLLSSSASTDTKKDLGPLNLDTGAAVSPNAFVNENSDEKVQLGNDILNSISTSVIELKEKLARAEFENQLLQNKLSVKRESEHSVLSGLLEASNTRCAKLEVENRQSRKKLLLLESRLKDFSSQNGASTSTAAGLNESSSDNTLALINRVEELQRLLFQKEQELRDSETKYKKNLQKARDVISTLNISQSACGSLHPSGMSSASPFNSSSLDETNLLKQQLRDREERLIELERDFYEFKKFKEIHERLIISAFYGLTTPMQWRNAEKRLDRTTLTSPPSTASSSINHTKHSH